MTIGEKIKHRRLELEISQEELAQRVGYCGKSSISQIESNRAQVPIDRLERIADVLDISVLILLDTNDIDSTHVDMDDIQKAAEKINLYLNS